MNCESYQDLLSDFIDGSLTSKDHKRIETHLGVCNDCAETRNDLSAIVGFCREQRGQYHVVPNERALWLRISNTIEAELAIASRPNVPASAGWWFRLMRRIGFGGSAGFQSSGLILGSNASPVADRFRQQQQIIDYWNQRVELNKARWNPQMRETFDRNMSVIDAAVNDSLRQLNQNPHDEVSEEILNAALNDKVELLKEFAEL